MTAIVARLRLDPPLIPSGDQGHTELRRELLKPEYHSGDTIQQVIDWVQRRVEGGLDAAHDAPPLSTLAAILVFLALLGALGALVSRARRTATGARPGRAVLTEEQVTAAELRGRARTALAEGRFGDAVVEGFRALTLQQIERGRLSDSPGATAREVSLALATEIPMHAEGVAAAAERFDAVRYGGRSATRDEAERVLALDDRLAGTHRSSLR